MDLLLICRAESEALVQGLLEGGRGWPLTAAGREAAGRLALRLAREQRLTALYSSPTQEAWETATIVADAVGLSPQAEPELREVDRGVLAGRPLKEVCAEGTDPLPAGGDIFTPFPGGESYAEMHVRVVRTINRLVAAAGENTIAIVTHPGPIHAFLLAFLRYAIEQRTELQLRCAPASLHHLRRDLRGRKEIVCLNDTAHLAVGAHPATIRRLPYRTANN